MRPTDELQAIMRSHPQVHYHCMDTSSEQGREECRAWASSARLGKLCLFNLAVDLQDKLYEDVSIEDLRRAFAAKCTAILTLCTVLAEQGLQIQWVINFSSATALLGNGGQAAYGLPAPSLTHCQPSALPPQPKSPPSTGAFGSTPVLYAISLNVNTSCKPADCWGTRAPKASIT